MKKYEPKDSFQLHHFYILLYVREYNRMPKRVAHTIDRELWNKLFDKSLFEASAFKSVATDTILFRELE